MRTFLEFSKEKAEEDSGIDLDHDNEKGESPAHKKKVKATKKKMLEFFHKRREGAKVIASQAKAKGGPSALTAWHFKAKDRPYAEVITAIEADKSEAFFVSKCRVLRQKLHFTKMNQETFQKLMGELEVFGEATAKLFGS